MRIRDRLFPEGGKIRYVLRGFNKILKSIFSITFIKEQRLKIKVKGWKVTFIEMRNYFFPKLINEGNGFSQSYLKWIQLNEPDKKELQNQRKFKFNLNPKISIIVPMYKTNINFFEELVDSVIMQTYSNWELCLADGSEDENVDFERIYKKDSRIKYKFIGENKGISNNTNVALEMATGDYVALLDHDDLLPKFSLFEIVKCINNNPNVEFIYSDEDKITTIDKPRFEPHFKPDFAIDFLRANNYICHFSVFKKELISKLKGENSKYDGAQDYDLVLRMSEIANNIIHIPKVLYHWRAHENSTAKPGDAKPYAIKAGKLAVEDHLKRVGLKGKVEYGATLGTYRIKYEVIGNPKVSILIPNKDRNRLFKNLCKFYFIVNNI